MSIVCEKSNTSIKRNDLAKIVEKMGARIVSGDGAQNGVFSIAITEDVLTGERKQKTSSSYQHSMISHRWLLDSISNATVLDYSKYIL